MNVFIKFDKDHISHGDIILNMYFYRVNTVLNDKESIRFLCPKIWNLIPDEIMYLENLNGFKIPLRKIPTECPCRTSLQPE